MNVHKNARLAFVRRLEMVKDMLDRGLTPGAASRNGIQNPDSQLKVFTECRMVLHSEAYRTDRIAHCMPMQYTALIPRKRAPGSGFAKYSGVHKFRQLVQLRSSNAK